MWSLSLLWSAALLMFVVSDWIQLSFIHFLLLFLCGTYGLHEAWSSSILFSLRLVYLSLAKFFTAFCRIHLWNIEIFVWVCVCVCVCARACACSCAFVRVCEFLEEDVIFHFVCASCIVILIVTILTQFSKDLWGCWIYYVSLVHYPLCKICIFYVFGLIFA
jgi:hypothetical protein